MTSLDAWLRFWRLMQRYHRFEVSGLEHLLRRDACLLVAYHGRPVAIDLCMLSVTLHDALGYLPHGVFHAGFNAPPLRRWIDELGFVTGDGEALAAAVARGEHVVTLPGGTREGCRSSAVRYRVDWGERTGYLRLALRYGLPIVPIASRGVDDTYLGLWDGYRMGKRARLPANLPLYAGVGPFGLWPFSLPFPVRIRLRAGAPVELGDARDAAAAGDREALLAAHRRVTGAVQDILDGPW